MKKLSHGCVLGSISGLLLIGMLCCSKEAWQPERIIEPDVMAVPDSVVEALRFNDTDEITEKEDFDYLIVYSKDMAATIRGLLFHDKRWYAYGDNGTIKTSIDGVTWTDRPATSGTTENIMGIVYDASRRLWWAYGSNAYWGSTDDIYGKSFVRAGVSSNYNGGAGKTFYSMGFDGSFYLLGGTTGEWMLHDDNIGLTKPEQGVYNGKNGECVADAHYAESTFGTIRELDCSILAQTKRNWNDWSWGGANLIRSRTSFEYYLLESKVSQSRILRLYQWFGNDDDADKDWDSGIEIKETLFTFTGSIRRIANNGGKCVAVGTYGKIYVTTSTTKTFAVPNWEEATSGTSETLNDVAWIGNNWVAVGNNGVILSSEDGKTWNKVESGTSANLFAVCGKK
jgi:hypothetical protein